ncbi:hypothetical protein NPIL_245751 [Nephila pilipes]|uniref:Uncharacterized protein n=1 Tax=Nephila pilipes TaxID=299642 RepID=A0A8X6PFS5_NEPPI|nr:hypothetical protein NPIL_245751 [Nephila pilipes]
MPYDKRQRKCNVIFITKKFPHLIDSLDVWLPAKGNRAFSASVTFTFSAFSRLLKKKVYTSSSSRRQNFCSIPFAGRRTWFLCFMANERRHQRSSFIKE